MKYIKRIQEQDRSRSFFIHKDAYDDFFVEKPEVRRKTEITISHAGNLLSAELQNEGNSDFRLINFRNKTTGKSKKPMINIGDLVVFTRSRDFYNLEIVSPASEKFHRLNSLMDAGNFILLRNDCPLNQILYGPPGTGKTDSTIEKSLEILEMLSTKPDIHLQRAENRETFKSLLNKRIFFTTLHPSYSYEDFVQGLKPFIKTCSSFNNEIFVVTHIQDELANDAVINYREDINKEYIFDDLVSNYKFIKEGDLLIVRDRANILGYAKVKKIKTEDTIKRLSKCPNCNKADLRKRSKKTPKYLCVSCRSEFEEPIISEQAIKKITAIYDHDLHRISLPKDAINNDIINYNPQVSIQKANKSVLQKIGFLDERNETLLFRYSDGIFLKVCKEAINDTRASYIIILDEINRANISKVFGELITLIEDDKRLGAENELTVTLPSGEQFGIPPNLYIIGTMNTADKSIALVDIALRRRFQFVPVYPDPGLIAKFGYRNDLKRKEEFLVSLNARLRKDKSVDFQIGHAYFMKDLSLEEVINQNVLPLLTEYYRNNLEEVKKIMEDLKYPVDENYWKETGLLKYVSK